MILGWAHNASALVTVEYAIELAGFGVALTHIWKLRGLPETALLDRGLQFMAEFMKELNEILGIKTKLSMAYHPQTDGQTEQVNQEIENNI